MRPFNLEKALTGEPLTTADFRTATKFSERKDDCVLFGNIAQYPYKAKVGKHWHAYTALGKMIIDVDSKSDLFMALTDDNTYTLGKFDKTLDEHLNGRYIFKGGFQVLEVSGLPLHQSTEEIEGNEKYADALAFAKKLVKILNESDI